MYWKINQILVFKYLVSIGDHINEKMILPYELNSVNDKIIVHLVSHFICILITDSSIASYIETAASIMAPATTVEIVKVTQVYLPDFQIHYP